MENIDKFVEESIPQIKDNNLKYSYGCGSCNCGHHEKEKYEWDDEFSDRGDGSGEADGSSDTIDNGCYIANIKF